MAIWPFNRRSSMTAKYDPDLPPEVQAYSRAERREKMGMAWLVGVISLVVTAIVITGLFFGGRWLYRSITGNKTNTTQTAETEAEKKAREQAEADKKAEEERKTGGAADAGNNPTPAPAPAPSTPAPVVPTTPQIPRTGPDEDL